MTRGILKRIRRLVSGSSDEAITTEARVINTKSRILYSATNTKSTVSIFTILPTLTENSTRSLFIPLEADHGRGVLRVITVKNLNYFYHIILIMRNLLDRDS